MAFQFALLVLITLVLVAQGQDLMSQLPDCALNCYSLLTEQLSCSMTDKDCLCKNSNTLMNGVASCAGSSCSVKQTFVSLNSTAVYCDIPLSDQSMTVDVVTGVFGGIALLLVLLRMMTRMSPFKTTFGWDDGLIAVVTVTMLLQSTTSYLLTKFGFGKDVFIISPENIDHITKWFYAQQPLYDFNVSLTKVSILIFYLRIFTDLKFKKMTYVAMGLCIAYLCAMVPTDIFQCTPISYTWTSWSGETQGHCLNIYLQAWASGILNILLDILVILLPIPHLLRLTMSRKKKIQVVAMFSVGLCVTFTSVARLTSLVRFRKTWNFTRDYTGVTYMSTLEVDIGIICACMPAIQLLLRRLAPGILGSSITESSHLYTHTGSHSRTRTIRHPSAHIRQSKSITMTITTTVADMPKDSDSVIELVDTKRQGHNSNADCGSQATVSTEHYPHRPEW